MSCEIGKLQHRSGTRRDFRFKLLYFKHTFDCVLAKSVEHDAGNLNIFPVFKCVRHGAMAAAVSAPVVQKGVIMNA